MISVKEAGDIVLANVFKPKIESVELLDSVDRVLAEDVIADMPMPPFNKSAMDGYACRYNELGSEMELIEIIAAGKLPEKTVRDGQCSKIMTGAKVPEGADCVFMVEYSEVLENGNVIFNGKDTKPNICFLGEDLLKGDVIIEKGVKITPAHIATLASVGYFQVEVYCAPKVGIVVTGSELVRVDDVPEAGQIRDSNGPQIYAQVQKAGGIPDFYGIVSDERELTTQVITEALEENDLVLISGGSSMGDWDFVPEILEECGMKILFDKISIKPGKPTTFAVSDSTACFGMPGNPVSTFVIFELFVKPWINGSMSCSDEEMKLSLQVSGTARRKSADRTCVLPVSFKEGGKVAPVKLNGSAHITAMTKADGLGFYPADVTIIEDGDMVDVRLI